VSDDLYGDEDIYDKLLHQAKINQKCQRCGYEIGQRTFIVQEGMLQWEAPRFRKYCMDCKPRRIKKETAR
jgi:hypothetical protein